MTRWFNISVILTVPSWESIDGHYFWKLFHRATYFPRVLLLFFFLQKVKRVVRRAPSPLFWGVCHKPRPYSSNTENQDLPREHPMFGWEQFISQEGVQPACFCHPYTHVGPAVWRRFFESCFYIRALLDFIFLRGLHLYVWTFDPSYFHPRNKRNKRNK